MVAQLWDIGPTRRPLCRPADLASSVVQQCAGQAACGEYFWEYSNWVCSNARGCGGGIAVRNATCRNATSSEQVEEFRCLLDTVPDQKRQPCALQQCVQYTWHVGEPSDCQPLDSSVPCGKVSGKLLFQAHPSAPATHTCWQQTR